MTVSEDDSIQSIKKRISESQGIPCEEIVLISGLNQLEDDETVFETQLQNEATVTMTLRLCGGKKKKKKRVYTKPKKIPHKHETVKMAVLNYFEVDKNGKVEKLKQESPEQSGCYLADHKDRMHCGKTGYMFYKMTKDGKRIAPVQNKPKKAADSGPAKKVVKKKKKWGKVYTYTPTKRDSILTKEKAEEIETDLKKAYVTTPNMFAMKHGITISLAKKILKENSEKGKFELAHKTAKNQIYS